MTIRLDQLFVCEQSPPKNLAHFVKFWSTQSYYPNEELYKRFINGPHTSAGLEELFRWKIGPRLFKTHLPRLKKHFISRHGHAVRLLKGLEGCEQREAAETFLGHFKHGGAIYRIFWLHCCNQSFPIYDQHVHRAMARILDKQPKELTKVFGDQKKIELYLDRYLPFFAEFKGMNGREVDQALWQFGKSLKKSQRGGADLDAAV